MLVFSVKQQLKLFQSMSKFVQLYWLMATSDRVFAEQNFKEHWHKWLPHGRFTLLPAPLYASLDLVKQISICHSVSVTRY